MPRQASRLGDLLVPNDPIEKVVVIRQNPISPICWINGATSVLDERYRNRRRSIADTDRPRLQMAFHGGFGDREGGDARFLA